MTEWQKIEQDVLNYWFGDSLENMDALERQSRRWFAGGKALDHEITTRFGPCLKPLAQQPLDTFSSPHAILAAILLLDQFPRHIYRGQAAAFAFDDKAVRLLEKAMEEGWDQQLHPVQRSFLYMPLQHAEDLHLQEQGVEAFRTLFETSSQEGAPPTLINFLQQALDYAVLHRDIIDEYGRFPHRNRALGRKNSAEEEQYLAKGKRFGQ